MAELDDLNIVDANNNGSAANAGFPENMAFASVNNAARALEGMLARWHNDNNGTLDTTGSSNAYLLTPNRSITAYTRGQEFEFEANHTNTGAATLNVSSLGATTIQKTDGAALGAGDIQSGGVYKVIYDGTVFQLVGTVPGSITLTSTAAVDLTDGDNVLNIGATTGQHIALDGNDIQSKANATTAGTININALGGDTNIGPQSGTGSVDLYHSGAPVLSSQTYGISVHDASGTDTRIVFEDDSNVELARLRATASALILESFNDGGSVSIIGNDISSVSRTMLLMDPDAGLAAYYAGILALQVNDGSLSVVSTVDDNPFIGGFQDDAATRNGYLQFHGTSGIFLRSEVHGANVSLQGEDTGGVARNVFVGDPDGNAYMAAAGVQRVAAVASGGLISGTLLDLNSGANSLTRLLVRNSIGGMDFTVAATSGQGSIRQRDAAGNAEDTWMFFDRNAGVTLRYNNSDRLATSSAGGTLTGTWNATTGLQVGGTAVSVSGHSHTASNVSDFAEAVSDQVGTMVTGNSETGIVVSYQDADNTLDFSQDWGALPSMTDAVSGTDEFIINDGGTYKTMTPNQVALPSNTASGAKNFASTDVGEMNYYTGSGHTWTMGAGIGQNNGYIVIVNSGSGALTIAGSGVTITSTNSLTDVSVGGTAVLIRESSTVWFLSGNLE